MPTPHSCLSNRHGRILTCFVRNLQSVPNNRQVRVAPAAVAATTLAPRQKTGQARRLLERSRVEMYSEVSQAVRADDEVPQAAPAVEVAPAEVPQAAPAVEVAPAEVPQAVPVESAPESAGTIIPAFLDPNFNFDDWPGASEFKNVHSGQPLSWLRE